LIGDRGGMLVSGSFELNSDEIVLAPNDFGRASRLALLNECETVGYGDRRRYLQARTGRRKIADGAVHRKGAVAMIILPLFSTR